MTNTMTYAEEQAVKVAKKADRAWKKTMAEAKVYNATFLPRSTLSVSGDKIMKRFLEKLDYLISSSTLSLKKFVERIVADPAGALDWSAREFDHAGDMRVATDLKEIITQLSVVKDEYSERSNWQIIYIVRDQLRSDILRAARYPERSTSVQSNEMARSIAAAKAKILEDLDNHIAFLRLPFACGSV